MQMPNMVAGKRKAWFHVDMDGLDAIYAAHGRSYSGSKDMFYMSAVANSLRFFQEQGAKATFFAIARDLENPDKRQALQQVVAAGHNIASHGLNHLYLNQISGAEKRREIIESKARLEDALGVECMGFRAPGYSIDFESLNVLGEAGYRYDSSVFPTYDFRKRLGLQRLYREPFEILPDFGLMELPLPSVFPGLPPFHPCFAFYLGRTYFRRSVRSFARDNNYLTLLFHLTDFAAPQKLQENWRINVYTNNYKSEKSKLAFLGKLMEDVRKDFAFASSEELVAGWPESAPDLNPRTVLGISTTHETGACITRDGNLLSGINEERLSRRKLDTKYPPVDSIREAIRVAGVAPNEIDAVAIAGLHWKDLLPQTLESLKVDVKDFHALNDYIPHFCRVLYRLFYFARARQYHRVGDFLEKEYGIRPKVYYVEHHEAHAASAYRTGAADRALIITADGVGDDVCITYNTGEGSTIRRTETFFYPNSFGQFYTACTQILGFKAGRHEGKITGLSGYGKPNEELIKKVEGTFFNTDGGFKLNKKYYAEGFVRLRLRDVLNLLRLRVDTLTLDYRNYKPPLRRLLRGYSREDVAYAFQYLLERELVRLTARHIKGPVDLVLAGGIFANVKLNMALSRMPGVRSIYIFPNMGDGGLGVGAALNIAGKRPQLAHDMYLGTAYGEAEIDAALAGFPELSVERPADLTQRVAEELANSKIVARCDGRMEFGPRALGNRSILYHGSDPSVNAWLNHQLRRTEFMPFAPICIYEDADQYFHVNEGEKRACEFMTLVVRCTDLMKESCPAAVHVDGTARPQLVKESVNPGMYQILQAYKRITGNSCLINTSFNMHEEPIVRSPKEAITAFKQSKLHWLVLGPYLVGQHVETAEPAGELAEAVLTGV
jgi:carbamoyltransferase